MAYSSQLGRGGIDNYVGLPLIVVLLTACWAGRNRVGWLLVGTFALVVVLAAGPSLMLTGTEHTYRLPWAGLWNLPIARSAEPSRFIVFGLLAAAAALALWLAAPDRSRPRQAARWGLGRLTAAVILTDSPTAYPAVQP